MNDSLDKHLAAMVDDILASYAADRRTQRIGEQFLPSRQRIVEMLEEIREVLFPGYFGRTALTDPVTVIVDRNLVTSRKPEDLPAFCRAAIEVLQPVTAAAG